jgi:hypothetical protein
MLMAFCECLDELLTAEIWWFLASKSGKAAMCFTDV